jgi:hypothetical protein
MDHPFFLAAVIIAFVTFGAVLAYVDRIAGRRSDVRPAE